MISALTNVYKIPELRAKITFTLIMFAIFRMGTHIPVPGVDPSAIEALFNNGSLFGLLDMFSGGALSKFSVFAMSITPYINASIIIQLLNVVVPTLEQWSKEGQEGYKKTTKVTRYFTVLLAFLQALGMSIGLKQAILNPGPVSILIIAITLTAGTVFLMWVGERITEKGVGNGISIVLTINILSRVPQSIATLFDQFVFTKTVAQGIMAAVVIFAIILLTVVLCIVLNDATRKIPVQYVKKMQGRRLVGGQSSGIPLKVNTAGVIPVIFASSLMSIPQIIISFVRKSPSGVGGTIVGMLNENNWFNPANWIYSVGLILYVVLIIFFAYFYTSITFNPIEVADNMKKQGGFIPGIRPGKPTEDYLNNVLNYIIFIGAVGLTVVVIIPIIFNGLFSASVSFGGTSIIIIVSVILETIKQIESQMVVRNYKGFLNE